MYVDINMWKLSSLFEYIGDHSSILMIHCLGCFTIYESIFINLFFSLCFFFIGEMVIFMRKMFKYKKKTALWELR